MRSIYLVPVLLTSVLVMAGCSAGRHAIPDKDDHHSAAVGMTTHGDHADGQGDDGKDDHGSAVGEPGNAELVDRVVSVGMDDTMRFTPASFLVQAGETIQFDIVNNGQFAHEFVLGSADYLQKHSKMMQKMPRMVHDEPNQVSLESAETGSVIWMFTTAGTVDIACSKPGHFEAGMRGLVEVVVQ